MAKLLKLIKKSLRMKTMTMRMKRVMMIAMMTEGQMLKMKISMPSLQWNKRPITMSIMAIIISTM